MSNGEQKELLTNFNERIKELAKKEKVNLIMLIEKDNEVITAIDGEFRLSELKEHALNLVTHIISLRPSDGKAVNQETNNA